jgi:hypothetical protein
MSLINDVKEFAMTHPGQYFTIDEVMDEFPERSRPTLAGCIATLKKRGQLIIIKNAVASTGAKAHYVYTNESKREKKIFAEKVDGNLTLTKAQLADAVEQIIVNFQTRIKTLKMQIGDMMKKEQEYTRKINLLKNEIADLKDRNILLMRNIEGKHSTITIATGE